MTLTQCHGFGIDKQVFHDDVTKWKHFPRNWSFVRGIHRSPVNSPHKGQWRGALMFSLICARINGWVNNHEAGDLRRLRAHYDVIVMVCLPDEMRSTHQDITKLGSFIPLATHTTWLVFGEILLETCFFVDFSHNVVCVFLGKALYWSHLRRGWCNWRKMERRCIGWILGKLCDHHSCNVNCVGQTVEWNSIYIFIYNILSQPEIAIQITHLVDIIFPLVVHLPGKMFFLSIRDLKMVFVDNDNDVHCLYMYFTAVHKWHNAYK